MIAAHHRASHGPHPIADFVGRGVIADHIAQVHHAIVGGRSLQTGLQRFQVGVNIAEHEQAHGSANLRRRHGTAREMSGGNFHQRRQRSRTTCDAQGAARLESAARRQSGNRGDGPFNGRQRFGTIGAQRWHRV